MDLQSALRKLYSMHQFSIKLGLERVQSLLDYIGNPHKGLKYFHIAGSNGKGSTASFLASILIEAGYKVGLYTSPHFVRFNERIQINGVEIEDDYIAAFITSLEKYIEKHEPTFFELTTALAFKYFKEAEIEYGVIETGLGGRLDATNVITPLASIITSISLEHTYILGNTIEKIAVEKAGIIKPGALVVTGLMPDTAENIIRDKSKTLDSPYLHIRDSIRKEVCSVNLQLNTKDFHLYSTPLLGEHQLMNSALAIKTISKVLNMDNGLFYAAGINNVQKNTGIQGRYEIVNQNPRVIFDSAHNLDSVKSFINEYSKEYLTYDERCLIFGSMKDKDISGMLKLLHPYFDKIYITRAVYERAATIEELIEIGLTLGLELIPIDKPSEFIKEFRYGQPNKCIVLLGSMYLIGHVKKMNI